MAAEQHAQLLFQDLFAATGWHPGRRHLADLMSAAASTQPVNGTLAGWDVASLEAVLLQLSNHSGNHSGGGGVDPGAGGPVDISWVGLVLGALVIAVNGVISVWLRLGLHGKLAVASVRCIVQLSLLGYILVPIFTASKWWLTLLYTLFMLAVAAVEAVSRPTQSYSGMLLQVLVALGLASSAIISYGLALVVQVRPWWDAQYLIPMLGMLLGNACSGVAVGLSTILDELSSGRDKVEMLLAMGATRMEATREVVQRASRMALTPLLNTMNVVGIVSIPGMMTGQILGGSDPATAARYQIIIMFLIGAATGISSVAVIFLAVVSVVDDRHRLRSERLTSRPSHAKGAVAWLGAQLSEGWHAIRTTIGQLFARTRLAFGGGGARRSRRTAAGYQPLDGGNGDVEGGGAGNSRGGNQHSRVPGGLQEVLVAEPEENGSVAAVRAPPLDQHPPAPPRPGN